MSSAGEGLAKRFGSVLLAALLFALPSATLAAPQAKPAKKPTPPARPPISASGVLSKEELVRVIMPAMKRPINDPFAQKVPSPFAGRKFSFKQPIKSSLSEYLPGEAYWTYRVGAELVAFFLPPATQSFTLYSNERKTGQRVGQNAFGVKVQIVEYASMSMFVYSIDELPLGDGLSWSAVMEPGAAKALTSRASLVVEGEIIGRSGEVTDCAFNETDATIDNPEDVTSISCLLYARIDRLAFVDGSVVLKEWVSQ